MGRRDDCSGLLGNKFVNNIGDSEGFGGDRKDEEPKLFPDDRRATDGTIRVDHWKSFWTGVKILRRVFTHQERG
jgi:hypothetical protein